MEDAPQQNGVPAALPAPVEPPRSYEHASIDDKGRLKLPAKIVEYLMACGVTKVFITSFDLQQVRLYPLSLWKVNENIFDNPGEHAEELRRLSDIAKHFGGDAEIDKSGRVLLPEALRKRMELEKQAVMVEVRGGGVNVLSKKNYDLRLETAIGHQPDDWKIGVKILK